MQERASDRTRRLHRVFGDVLPDSTGDDRPDHDVQSTEDRDQWLVENRPPHHDQDG